MKDWRTRRTPRRVRKLAIIRRRNRLRKERTEHRQQLAAYYARSSREAESRWNGERLPLEPLQD